MDLPDCSPHAQRVPQFRFQSAEHAPGDALALWRDCLSRSWELNVDEGAGAVPFHAEAHMWNMDRLMFSSGRFGPTQVRTRRERNIRADQFDHYRVILLREGRFDCDAEGRRTSLTPGRFVITDMARAESNESCSASLALFVPRSELDDALPHPIDLHGLSPDNACANLLAEHLVTLEARLPEATLPEIPSLSRATVNLLAASIAATPVNLEASRAAVEHILLRRARRFIEMNLKEEELGAAMLCAQLRVARSTLYRLFEPLGGVSQFIKERRLARVHELLGASALTRSIADLAEQHGFKSAAHFSKAFRAQYGYSAREVVREAQARRPAAAAPNRLDQWLGGLMH